MAKRVFVVGGADVYANHLITNGWEFAKSVADADLVLFTGGEDVTPAMYGQEKHPNTYSSINRDKYEVVEFTKASDLGKPMLGICRGSQFLTVMAGGKMIQDVTDHGIWGSHTCTLWDGREILVNSLHHQMCDPTGVEHELLGWSSDNRSKHYEGARGEAVMPYTDNTGVTLEPEIFFYPKIKALGFQCHPEMLDIESDCVQLMFELIESKLGL